MDAERIIELRARIAALERERDALKDEIDYAMGQCDGKSIGKIIEERDEAHAAIRWLMARFHPYVNVPIEHAPAIRRVMGEKG